MNDYDDFNFDDYFEQQKQKKVENKPTNPEEPYVFTKRRAFGVIGVYILIMFVLATVLTLFIASQPNTLVSYTESDSMIQKVGANPYSIGYTTRNLSESEMDTYNVTEVAFLFPYHIIMNQSNPLLETPESITVALIEDAFSGELVNWDPNYEYINPVKIWVLSDYNTFFSAIGVTPSDTAIYHVAYAYYDFTDNVNTLLNIGIYLVLMITIIPLTKKLLKKEFVYFKKPIAKILLDIIIAYAIMYGINIIGAMMSEALQVSFNYVIDESVNQQSIVESLMSSYGILMILTTVIMAPIIEELIFRKAIFTLFRDEIASLVIGSILFGLIHVISEVSMLDMLIQFIGYAASGVALAIIYIKNKKNIWASILAHSVFNLVSVIIIFFL